MLGSIGCQLCDGLCQIIGIDVHDQLLIRVLHHIFRIGVLVLHPSSHAQRLKAVGQVTGLFVDLHHLGFKAREVEDVVDEVNQVVGIVEDTFSQCFLVGRCLRVAELVHVVHHRVQRCTDLLYHVLHEIVLRVLHLLHLRSLLGQLLLDVAQFTEVAQQSQVFRHASLLVVHRRQTESQIQPLAAFDAQCGTDIDLERLVHAVVHLVQHAHGQFLRLVVDERHTTCLRQGVLHLVGTPEDGQRVRSGRVAGQSQVAFMEQVVDVVIIFLEHRLHGFQTGLFDGILLNAVDTFGDVTTEDEDTEQLVVIVVDGHHAELIAESALAPYALDVTLLERNLVQVEDLRGIETVGIAQIRQSCVEALVQVYMLVDDLFAVAVVDLTGLRVDVTEVAVLVEEDDAHHRGVEDRPVAQGALIVLALQLSLLRHVFLRADDDGWLAVLVATQDREDYHEVVQLVVASFHVLRPQFQRDLFLFLPLQVLLLVGQSVEGVLQPVEVLRAVALRELVHRVGIGYLSVLVAPGKRIGLHVVSPDAHLTGL